jgi:2-polyprenyl-3-methyl-5-hydroxy-6-metoxy-1,4-benzoquinol methylase
LAAVLERERAHPNSTLDARRIVDSVSQLLGPHGGRRFLDVGCGYGFFSREAIGRGFSVVPLEMASTERTIAAEMLGIEPVAASFENYECSDGDFDVVLMSHVLEHVYDVNEWVEKAARLLRPNGVCAVALPNFGSIIRLLLGTGDPFICPPMHLNHFSGQNLSQLMAAHGLTVRKIEWASRIPPTAFSRRLPSLLRPMGVLAGGLTSIGLSLCDALGIGMTTTVYAVRQ